MIVRTSMGHNRDSWDASLHHLGGDLLQCWQWGEFKQRQGWNVERIHGENGEGFAQVLFRRHGPFSIAYVPRGPVFDDTVADGCSLLHAFDEACAAYRAVTLIVEPLTPLPDAWLERDQGFVRGPAPIQTPRTVLVNVGDDKDMLAQMRKDTRYNIVYAQRHGVDIEHATIDSSSMDLFYKVLEETAKRGEFGIHSRAYYDDFVEVFADTSLLLFSRVNGEITAGLIAVRTGDQARSMYAGSATGKRFRGDAALLRFEAMRWARNAGCTRYDLGGIAHKPPSEGTASIAGSKEARGSDLDGVETFKTGFGGEIVTYPPTLERVYRPWVSWIMQRLNDRLRPAPE